MTSFKSLARAMFLGFRRDRTALFFTIALPLLFLLIIGGLFAKQSTPRSTVLEIGAVPVVDQMPAGMRAGFEKSLKITKIASRDSALEKVKKGDYDAALEQNGDQVVIHYSAADQVKSGTAEGQVEGLVQAANQAASIHLLAAIDNGGYFEADVSRGNLFRDRLGSEPWRVGAGRQASGGPGSLRRRGRSSERARHRPPGSRG